MVNIVLYPADRLVVRYETIEVHAQGTLAGADGSLLAHDEERAAQAARTIVGDLRAITTLSSEGVHSLPDGRYEITSHGMRSL